MVVVKVAEADTSVLTSKGLSISSSSNILRGKDVERLKGVSGGTPSGRLRLIQRRTAERGSLALNSCTNGVPLGKRI
ncbi:hypothetical protein E2C01_009382 [Portunus trituberculatus]|uniref:Uncharacterized protein n=1 Tax=Portunus trituberculatus TaxID=210409 RepID=A0A5B7D5H5_PORTR|nr:hypothetical protein [Portunus trituberculatus]